MAPPLEDSLGVLGCLSEVGLGLLVALFSSAGGCGGVAERAAALQYQLLICQYLSTSLPGVRRDFSPAKPTPFTALPWRRQMKSMWAWSRHGR